ncbi:hypothetical protein JJE00_03865 [Candidatus Bathyarchaeota archaeon]|nr:hypothetical protein [Candidatus Bathyarchaeota archaeon]
MIVGFLAVASTGLLIEDQSSSVNGTLQTLNIEAYEDFEATLNCSMIDFGSLSPGKSSNQTVYIKNIGSEVVFLSMNVQSWEPSDAEAFLVLSWNRDDHILNPGESIGATFILDVDENVFGFSDFSFNITIVGNQIEEI